MGMTADQLPDDPDALKAMVLARDAENARLIQIIKELQRHRFGRRAETLPEDQLLLGLEEAEQIEAAVEEAKATSAERLSHAAKRRANRGALPAHLPRVETVVDIEDHACPCCRKELHRIGEDVSERLDIVPAQLRVIVVRRPKYASHGDYLVKCDLPSSQFRHPRSEPNHVTRPGCRASSTSHAVAAPGGSTNIPLTRAGSGRRDHSADRLLKPCIFSVRLPGSERLIRPLRNGGKGWWKWSCGFHERPFDDDAGGRIFP